VRTISTAFALASVLVASLIACGGGDQQPPTTPTAPSASSAPTASAPTASASATTAPTAAAPDAGAPSVADTATPHFNDLPKDKKIEIMSKKVVPNVGKDFKDFNAKEFGDFGCTTCHGPKKNQDPHQVLPKLTFSNGGFDKMKAKHPDMVKFMQEKVLPDMAAALGEKQMDPATKQGFGCGGCHEIK
jgi:hypothetical protein